MPLAVLRLGVWADTGQADKRRVEMSDRIGFFGGAFDPVHLGHMQVASCVRDELGLDLVLMAPAGEPYLRTKRPAASPEERFEMVEAAVSGVEGIVASRIDIDRPGPTYTVDSLADVAKLRGGSSHLFLIVGVDAAQTMRRWRCPARLHALSDLVVVGRPGTGAGLTEETVRREWARQHSLPEDLIYIEGPMLCHSATEIRRAIRSGRSVAHLVPAPVWEIIVKKGLYR